MSIFDQWKLTPAELDEIISANPSLRGITLGYVAKQKYLLATLIEVCLPLELPFESEPFRLLDKIVVEKTRAR